jgi:hypothetical protein
LTLNPKIKGSNLATGMMSVKMAEKMIQVEWLYPSGMVVENLTHNFEVEANYNRYEKIVKNVFMLYMVR